MDGHDFGASLSLCLPRTTIPAFFSLDIPSHTHKESLSTFVDDYWPLVGPLFHNPFFVGGRGAETTSFNEADDRLGTHVW